MITRSKSPITNCSVSKTRHFLLSMSTGPHHTTLHACPSTRHPTDGKSLEAVVFLTWRLPGQLEDDAFVWGASHFVA